MKKNTELSNVDLHGDLLFFIVPVRA